MGIVLCSSAMSSAGSLAVQPTALGFGKVVVGQTLTLPATLVNAGSASITVRNMVPLQGGWIVSHPTLPLTLTPGKSIGIKIEFAPTVVGDASGTISFNSGSTYLRVTGAGINKPFSASPSSLNFGSVQVAKGITLPIVIKNVGSYRATIAQMSMSPGFTTEGLSLPLTLSPGQSFTFKIMFAPTSSGTVNGYFKGLSSAGATLIAVPLSGTATALGQLSLSPGSLSFGNVNVGSTVTQAGKLSATTASVTVTSAASNSSEFVLSGISLPTTIPAGGSASYSVTFKPQMSGAASATISFASSASNPTVSESVTGTGVAITPPPTHSVTLSWKASTSNVAGYNIYRGSQSGGPYTKLNSAIETATTYIDSNVAASTTYYYVTTAVNSNGGESTYSNQVQVTIP